MFSDDFPGDLKALAARPYERTGPAGIGQSFKPKTLQTRLGAITVAVSRDVDIEDRFIHWRQIRSEFLRRLTEGEIASNNVKSVSFHQGTDPLGQFA